MMIVKGNCTSCGARKSMIANRNDETKFGGFLPFLLNLIPAALSAISTGIKLFSS
jgi:hypothetical protein